MNEIDKERLAIELKKWLRSQQKFKFIRELVPVTGIPYACLKDYFAGRAVPPGERRRRLADLTGIATLGPWRTPSARAESPLAEQPSRPGEQQSLPAEGVAAAVRQLMAALEPFKKGTAEDRAVLRRTVAARDVGYLTSLLKAMYDEDQFQTWVYFTHYTPDQR